MQTPFDDDSDQQPPTSITGFVNFLLGNNVHPTSLEDFDLSEPKTPSDEIILKHLSPTPQENSTPQETPTSQQEDSTPQETPTSQQEDITPQYTITLQEDLTPQYTITLQNDLTLQDSSFNFGPLLQRYQLNFATFQQSLININNLILLTTEIVNFDTIKTLKLDNYNNLKTQIENSMVDCNIRIQNIVNIQNLSKIELDNLYTLYTYVGNMDEFLRVLTIKYIEILGDQNFKNLVIDVVNSDNNKKLIGQYIYQLYSSS